MDNEPRWLSIDEQRAWRGFIYGSLRLFERLDRELREGHGLSLAEYEILVHLSEAPQHSLRMADLAALCNHSRSRLSHTVSRLERDQLVKRSNCPEDGRGVVAALTEAGYGKLQQAARTHVSGVRNYLVDVAAPEDLQTIGRVFEKIASP